MLNKNIFCIKYIKTMILRVVVVLCIFSVTALISAFPQKGKIGRTAKDDIDNDFPEYGLFEGEDNAKANNHAIKAYLDIGTCGDKGDDYNVDWCEKDDDGKYDCPREKSTPRCSSGKAYRQMFKQGIVKLGCEYLFYAEYICDGCCDGKLFISDENYDVFGTYENCWKERRWGKVIHAEVSVEGEESCPRQCTFEITASYKNPNVTDEIFQVKPEDGPKDIEFKENNPEIIVTKL